MNKVEKKILAVSVMQSWGGGEEFLQKLIKNIEEFRFIIASPGGNVFNHFKTNEFEVIRIESLKKIYKNSDGWNLFSFLKIIINIKFSTFSLIKLIFKEKPDLILANGLFAALYILPSVILLKKKLILVQHLIFTEESVEKRILKVVNNYADKIVCVSNAVKNNIVKMLNLSGDENIIIIPNGIDIPAKQSIIEKKENEIINIAYIGSIIRLKGIHLIIEAAKDILKKGKANLLIYGEEREDEDSKQYLEELKVRVNELDLNDKIYFMGFEENKEKIYSNIDIVINYTLIPESFSYTVIEAMAYKKIVIASAAGGPEEIISDGENGFLVKPNDVKLLEEKINFCITNFFYESNKKIRENAYLRIKNNYSNEKFVSNYQNLFNSLFLRYK